MSRFNCKIHHFYSPKGPGVRGIFGSLYSWAPRLPPVFSQIVMVPVPGLKT